MTDNERHFITRKIKNLESDRDYMKQINLYYREHGTCKGCIDVPDEYAECLDETVRRYSSIQSVPFSYELKKNAIDIRHYQYRLSNGKSKVQVR